MRLISGTMTPHDQLEQDLAQFKQAEAALTFGTGYTTNLGPIPSLIDQDGFILADRYCHASLIEACRLVKAKLRVFHHNDVALRVYNRLCALKGSSSTGC